MLPTKLRFIWSIGFGPSFVVCHLLTFHILIFSSETHQPNELKFVGSIYGRSSLKSVHFVMIHYQTWQELPVVSMFVNRSGRNEQSS
jgi:hypothetical protein